jgi:hypothetical protein
MNHAVELYPLFEILFKKNNLVNSGMDLHIYSVFKIFAGLATAAFAE